MGKSPASSSYDTTSSENSSPESPATESSSSSASSSPEVVVKKTKSKRKEVDSEESSSSSTEPVKKTEKSKSKQVELSSSGPVKRKKSGGPETSFRNQVDVVEPIHLTWNHVYYSVKEKKKRGKPEAEDVEKADGKSKKKNSKSKDKGKGKKEKGSQTKEILHNLSGEVKPGRVLAVMGSTGAGKSSLLNILAKRVTKGVEGDILLNGQEIPASRFKRIAAYVQQDDVMLPEITVRETLRFAANLRLPSALSSEEKARRVENVMEELGLIDVADTPIGSPEKRGISGGERKRVTIGIELITNPSIIFLDEPTSGLDSFTAFNIMDTLVQLASKGRTIICTIHQPRSNIFELMDKLLILSAGKTVYFGNAKDAVEHWDMMGHSVPKFSNPADFFLDTTTIDKRTPELRQRTQAQVNAFIEWWDENGVQEFEPPKKLKAPDSGNKYATSRFVQFWHIFVRALQANIRNKAANIIRLAQTLLVTFVISFLYYQIDTDQTSITDRSGALFFLLINQAFGNMIGALGTFFEQKGTFIRERSNGTYSVGAYYWAKSLAELPQQIFFPLLTGLIVYYIMGLRDNVGAYFVFVLLLWMVGFTAGSLGFAVGTALPTMEAANAAAPFVIVIFIIFGGFYVNSVNIPAYFIWIQKISFFTYGFEALMINEFWDRDDFYCKEGQYVEIGSGANATQVCATTTGEAVLTLFGLEYDYNRVWIDVIVLAAMIVIYRILAYLGLRFLTGKAKN